MDASWIQLTDEHSGKTAGAVLEEQGTPFVPMTHSLMVICGNDKEAVACDPDDTFKPSDLALGVFSLPEFVLVN